MIQANNGEVVGVTKHGLLEFLTHANVIEQSVYSTYKRCKLVEPLTLAQTHDCLKYFISNPRQGALVVGHHKKDCNI